MASADGGAYRLVVVTVTDYNHAHILNSYSLTVFSPSGKLVQIEHALAAVSSGTTSLGIKGKHSPKFGSSFQSERYASIERHRYRDRKEDFVDFD
jgi:hypothetical protein